MSSRCQKCSQVTVRIIMSVLSRALYESSGLKAKDLAVADQKPIEACICWQPSQFRYTVLVEAARSVIRSVNARFVVVSVIALLQLPNESFPAKFLLSFWLLLPICTAADQCCTSASTSGFLAACSRSAFADCSKRCLSAFWW